MSLAENIFCLGNANSLKNTPAECQSCAIFVAGLFSKGKSFDDDGETPFVHKLFLWPPSFESLAVAMNFMACSRWRFSCSQPLVCEGHL